MPEEKLQIDSRSFQGGRRTRGRALFEYANGGTVFLDEVSETSLAMQAKLLRVIQNREIQPVGSPEVRQINARMIAATNRELRAEVDLADLPEHLQHQSTRSAEGEDRKPMSLEVMRTLHIQRACWKCARATACGRRGLGYWAPQPIPAPREGIARTRALRIRSRGAVA